MNLANPEDFEAQNASRMDDQLMVRFHLKDRPSKTEKDEAGKPIWVPVEYVEIRIPGQTLPAIGRPATFQDKQRFAKHYDAFKQRMEMPTIGTPLAKWPLIKQSELEQLSFVGVKTVEQLAELQDTYAGQMMGGYGLKQKAQRWLEDESSNVNLKAENDDMKAQMAEMKATLDSLTADKQPQAEPVKSDEEIIADKEALSGALDDNVNETPINERDQSQAVDAPAKADAKRTARRRRSTS